MQEQQAVLPNIKTRTLGEIAIREIDESKSNPRKTFDDLTELAASIRRQGVLSPVLVRLADGGRFELVAGARRVRASKLAGYEKIPAIAVECADDEAREIQIVENTQRQDVHPMEEAQAIEQLLSIEKKRGSADPLDAVARRLGKTRAHIHRRMRFLKLPDAAREAFLKGEMTAEHALVIARLPRGEFREKAFKLLMGRVSKGWDDEIPTAIAFASEVERVFLLSLRGVEFDTADTELVPEAGACGPCPKRTGNAMDLFGGVDGEDLCTDGACFKKKISAAWKKRKAAAKKSGEHVLTGEEIKKTFPYGGHHTAYNSEWEKVTEEKVRARLLKEGKKPAIAQVDGRIVELWRRKDLERATKKQAKKAKTPTRRPPEEIAAEKKAKAAERTRRENEEIAQEAHKNLLKNAILRAPALPDAGFLDLLWRLVVAEPGCWVLREIADRRKLKPANVIAIAKPSERKSILTEYLLEYLDDPSREAAVVNWFYGKTEVKAEIAKIKATRDAASKVAESRKKKGGKK